MCCGHAQSTLLIRHILANTCMSYVIVFIKQRSHHTRAKSSRGVTEYIATSIKATTAWPNLLCGLPQHESDLPSRWHPVHIIRARILVSPKQRKAPAPWTRDTPQYAQPQPPPPPPQPPPPPILRPQHPSLFLSHPYPHPFSPSGFLDSGLRGALATPEDTSPRAPPTLPTKAGRSAAWHTDAAAAKVTAARARSAAPGGLRPYRERVLLSILSPSLAGSSAV